MERKKKDSAASAVPPPKKKKNHVAMQSHNPAPRRISNNYLLFPRSAHAVRTNPCQISQTKQNGVKSFKTSRVDFDQLSKKRLYVPRQMMSGTER